MSDRKVGEQIGFALGVREVVWLSGADRLAFLRRILAGHSGDLSVGEGCADPLLDSSGHVVDLLDVHHGNDGTLLVTSGRCAQAIATHLRDLVLYGDDVRVTDAADQVAVLTLLGPTLPERLTEGRTGQAPQGPVSRNVPGSDAAAAGHPDAASLPAAAGATAGTWLNLHWDGQDVWLLRHPEPLGLGGWDVVAPPPLVSAIRDSLGLEGDGFPVSAQVALQTARVAGGIPAYPAEIGPATGANPLELGLRPVLDFAKGCYVGQEVVARLDSHDNVQRHLVRLDAGAEIHAGATIRDADGRPTRGRYAEGTVTTAVVRDGATTALGIVPTRFADEGTMTVQLPSGETIAARADIVRPVPPAPFSTSAKVPPNRK